MREEKLENGGREGGNGKQIEGVNTMGKKTNRGRGVANTMGEKKLLHLQRVIIHHVIIIIIIITR